MSSISTRRTRKCPAWCQQTVLILSLALQLCTSTAAVAETGTLQARLEKVEAGLLQLQRAQQKRPDGIYVQDVHHDQRDGAQRCASAH